MTPSPGIPPYPGEAPQPTPSKRKKRRGWRIFCRSIFSLICFVLAVLAILAALIDTDGVHKALLRFARQQASKALGANVQIGNLVLHWGSLSLDIYSVKIAGAGPHPNPPLLQLQHAEVSVRIVSIFKRKWYLSSLRIDKPVVWIQVDRNGHSNLPALKGSTGGSNNLLFALGIRHAILDGGQVYCNGVPRKTDADLHNLELHTVYTPSGQTYSGEIAYDDGRLRYGAYRPIPHNMAMAFKLTPTTFKLNRARLAVGDSTLHLTATVEHYRHAPAMQANYQVLLDGTQLRHLLADPSIPSGVIRAAGAIHFDNIPGQPLLRTLTVNGDLSSRRLQVKSASMSAQISNLTAHYAVSNGDAVLKDFHVQWLGGNVTAQGVMMHLGEKNAHSAFRAVLHNISLAQLKQMAGKQAAVKSVVLSGMLNATANATWGKTLKDLVACVDARIHADVSGTRALAPSLSRPARRIQAAGAQPPPVAGGPFESEIHATYTRANGQLQLANSYLRTAQTMLTLNGTLSRSSSLEIHLKTGNPTELVNIMEALRAPSASQKLLNLAGTVTFSGAVTGSLSAPHLTGELTAQNLHIDRSGWKLIRAGVDAGQNHATLRDAVLVPATSGRIEVSARAALDKWRFSKQSPIQAQVRVVRIELAALTDFMTAPPPVTGTLSANLNLHGSLASPEGNADLWLTKATAYHQPINALRLNMSGDSAQARAKLTVRFPAGSVYADAVVQPKQRPYTAQLTSSGIALNKIPVLKTRNIEADGVAQLRASGQGSFANPELSATVRIPTLTVSKQTITGVNLQLSVANHVADAALISSALNSFVQAKATVQLTGDYMTDASLKTSVLNLKPLLAIYSPSQAQNVSGQTQIDAILHGPAKNLKQIEAHVTIPVLNLAYQNKIQLAESAPIQVNYRNGVLDLPAGGIRGTDTALTFEAHVPTNRSLPMSLRLGGTVNLQLAQLFSSKIHSSGQLKLNIDSHGPMTNGEIGGEIDVVNASFAEDTMPVGLENGNGVLKLTTDRVNIASFEGNVGGGKVQLQGGVAYRPRLSFDLGMTAKGIRLLYPQGLRETMGTNIRLSGTAANSLVTGTVNLTDLSFTPGFDLTSFAGRLSSGVAVPPAPGAITQNVHLNLNVRSINNLDLVSRQLSVDGSAGLQITGTAAQPVILGRVNLTGGEILFNGNRFLLSGGTIQFVNPSQTEPVLNLGMTTTIQQYKISMTFRGPAEQIHADYTSDPALPTADIIHLLAFGDTSEAAASNIMPANQQAESLVASQVASQVTSRISKLAGISQLSVSPVLQGGTAEGPPGATITIRQRVTGNLFITFSSNVASTQDEVIQGEYKISPRVSFSATHDPNAGFGFDTLIRNSW